MENMGLNGLLIVLMAGFLFPFKKREEYSVLLTRNDSLILKGYFSLVIICHHLAQRIEPGSIFQLAFNDAGYIAVAIYFFITGYGVMKSYLTKSGYADHFLKNHMKSVIVPALAAVCFHWLAYAIQKDGYSISEFFGRFFINSRSTSFLWYVFMIGFFYPSIARTMKNAGGDGKKLIYGALKFVVISTAICLILVPFAFWIYDTTHLILVGMVAAFYEKDWMNYCSKHTWIRFFGSLMLSFGCLGIAFMVLSPAFGYVWGMNFYRSIDSVLFIIMILLVFSKIEPCNGFMIKMGTISYEIYLIHGIFLMLLRGPLIHISNDFIWVVMTIGLTIPAAFLFHKLIVKFRQ